jgi:hypothetical protein
MQRLQKHSLKWQVGWCGNEKGHALGMSFLKLTLRQGARCLNASSASQGQIEYRLR